MQPESAVPHTQLAGPVLSYAVANEDTEVVKALLETDTINLDLQGDCPNTPLHDATLKNHVAITELLLSRGASPDLPSGKYKNTPLLQAAIGNHVGVAEVLLSHGASPDLASGQNKTTPLLEAAGRNREICGCQSPAN